MTIATTISTATAAATDCVTCLKSEATQYSCASTAEVDSATGEHTKVSWGDVSRELFTVSIPGTLRQTLRALELVGFGKAERHLPLELRCSVAPVFQNGPLAITFPWRNRMLLRIARSWTGDRSACGFGRCVWLRRLDRESGQPHSGDPRAEAGTSSGTGQLTVGITDSPFSDALAVLITFSEVSVHRSVAAGSRSASRAVRSAARAT